MGSLHRDFIWFLDRTTEDRLEDLIDGRIMPGTGYPVIYNIVCSIFDNIKINLDISKIIDPVTKLNEIFNIRRKLGDSYNVTKKLDSNNSWVVTIELLLEGNKYIINGNPSKDKAQISEIDAAQKTLDLLKNKGIEWSRKSIK
jgi:dsRNA-specific ribonuclease